MDDVSGIGKGIVGMISAVIGLAILAVILSQGATTVNVLRSFFSGLSSLIAVAVSPITGGNTQALQAAAAGLSATGNGSYAPVAGYGFGNVGSYSASGASGGITFGGSNGQIGGSVNISGAAISQGISSIGGLFNGTGGTDVAGMVPEFQ
jgi:PRD1 phage membrane DNA delivery